MTRLKSFSTGMAVVAVVRRARVKDVRYFILVVWSDDEIVRSGRRIEVIGIEQT